jgi:hypothetical protein
MPRSRATGQKKLNGSESYKGLKPCSERLTVAVGGDRLPDNRDVGKRGILTQGKRKCHSQPKSLWGELERAETSVGLEKTDIFLRTKRV